MTVNKPQNNQQKRVLIVAFACAPNWPSEPGVGWNFSQEMVKSYDLTTLTRVIYKEKIEAEPNPGIKYLYYELPTFFLNLEHKFPMGEQLYYFIWQWCAYFWLRKHLKKQPEKIDLLHHLNFGTTWISPSAFLIDAPVVWGPLGGGSEIPKVFLRRLGLKAIIRERVYKLMNLVSYISPQSFLIRKKAEAIIFRFENAQESFPKTTGKLVRVISETAAPLTMVYEGKKEFTNTINALCIGRLIYWKGYEFAVKGFHKFLDQGGKGTLTLYGKGDDETMLKAYIKEHNLEDFILLKGHVPNEEVKQQLVASTVMLHPSFRDGGSWAIMEAMAFGLPVICLDTSGPRDMVTHDCGYMLPMESPDQVVNDIAASLKELATDTEKAESLSANARERIKDKYNWTYRGQEMAAIYEQVLTNHAKINRS